MLAKLKKASNEKRIQYGDFSLPTFGNEEMFDVLGDIQNTIPGNHPLETEQHLWKKNPDGRLWIPR
jgi:hypothetical protein